MAKKTAVCGICTALSVLSLYFACLLRTNTIFFMGASAFFVSVAIVSGGVYFGILTYISSSLLSYLLIPDKMLAFSYMAFGGIYPVAKAIIERINNLAAEWALKLACFGIAAFALYRMLLPKVNMPIYLAAAAALAVFVIYDIALSYGITIFKKRFKNIAKNS